MRFIYFDEVKYHPPVQPKHWIGALSVQDSALAEIEAKMNQIAAGFFGKADLDRNTEFHAVHMIQGNAHFKGRAIEERLSTLENILRVANEDPIRRINVAVSPGLMTTAASTAPDRAFMFFVEKAQQDLTKCNECGILIGDLDGEYADNNVSNLSKYRTTGTPYYFGKPIDRVLDSAYFIPSHHSRMIQLADCYTYILQLMDSPEENDKYPKARIRKFVREHTNLWWANSYKDWPTPASWALIKKTAAYIFTYRR